ncbi:hypothetical protein H6P81_002357 [Aristolochia fimbriata]|uniref:Uncharacterized protein n=1 Tax=Aristolochia fimbriata TaxID=158543 RepID=A0AAV7FB72_ARIFI|nr:hypothetical protein H6P81_002357 [Aristolochia fimbriata]
MGNEKKEEERKEQKRRGKEKKRRKRKKRKEKEEKNERKEQKKRMKKRKKERKEGREKEKRKRKKKESLVAQIVVQAAKEYPQQLGVNACIRLFEQFKSYEGSYFFLWTYLCSRLDPDIHFMYIEGAAKTGQIKDVKSVNPRKAPLVVVQLCDDECPEDFIKVLLYLSVLSFQMILLFSNVERRELVETRRIAAYILRRPLAAKEYPQPLGVDACIRLFEQFKSYEGLYFFLGRYLSSRLDPDIHFKHTEGVAKTGQINYVERVTRESKFYDPEKKKNLLMKAMLPDARPLINVCGRFGFVPDLTHYDVNPGNGPLVVVQLLDDECPEDFHQSVRSFLPEDPLMVQCEMRLIDAAKEYPQPLGVDACIRLFEQFKSYEGSYFFLGTYLSSRLDPDIHFKHIEGAAKNG